MQKITQLPEELKDLSLTKIQKYYNFLCQKTELSEKEQRHKQRLIRYIEIILQNESEWAALILFTEDKELIALCQDKINVQEIVDKIIDQPLSIRLINNFLKNLYNLN